MMHCSAFKDVSLLQVLQRLQRRSRDNAIAHCCHGWHGWQSWPWWNQEQVDKDHMSSQWLQMLQALKKDMYLFYNIYNVTHVMNVAELKLWPGVFRMCVWNFWDMYTVRDCIGGCFKHPQTCQEGTPFQVPLVESVCKPTCATTCHNSSTSRSKLSEARNCPDMAMLKPVVRPLLIGGAADLSHTPCKMQLIRRAVSQRIR